MWNLDVVNWLYGKREHIFFDALCNTVANNQVTVKNCGFYDGFTLFLLTKTIIFHTAFNFLTF